MEEIKKQEQTQQEKEFQPKKIENIFKGELEAEINPFLKPVLDGNENFVNNQKLLNRVEWDYKSDKSTLNEFLDSRVFYNGTLFVNTIQIMARTSEQIDFLMDNQISFLKETINEMIEIAQEKFEEGLVEKESEASEEIATKEEIEPQEPKETPQEKTAE